MVQREREHYGPDGPLLALTSLAATLLANDWVPCAFEPRHPDTTCMVQILHPILDATFHRARDKIFTTGVDMDVRVTKKSAFKTVIYAFMKGGLGFVTFAILAVPAYSIGYLYGLLKKR